MSIENISEGLGSHHILKGYLNAKGKTKTPKEEENKSPNISQSADRVEISENAKKLADRVSLVERLREELKGIPKSEIRREKIEQAMNRIHAGYYGDKEVLDEVIDVLLKESEGIESFGSTVDSEVTVSDSDPEISWDKIQEVGQKIEELFYERREVLETIVDRLLGS